RASTLYGTLSDFQHTKGQRHSSFWLNNRSNINQFDENSFGRWLELLSEVVEIVATFHLLKYPVGLQATPLEDKFGLNGPVGGFLRPDQLDLLKQILPPEVLVDLQQISDSD